jgi:hypothetical protein
VLRRWSDCDIFDLQVDQCRAAQQLAALQQRTLRGAERLWQLPAGCAPAAATPADVERLIAGGKLEVRLLSAQGRCSSWRALMSWQLSCRDLTEPRTTDAFA